MSNPFKGLFALVVAGCLGFGCSSGTSQGDQNGAAGGDLAGPTPEALAEFGGVRTCFQNGYECDVLRSAALDQCRIDAVTFPEYNCVGRYQDNWPRSCVAGDSDECGVYSYSFDDGELISEVRAACDRAVARDESCGEVSVSPACDQAGRVESPNVVAAYDCIAGTACGDPVDACYPPAGPSLGSEICERIEGACATMTCKPEWESTLNLGTGWWRDQTVAAARACADEPYCRNMTECLDEWSSVVLDVPGQGHYYPFDY